MKTMYDDNLIDAVYGVTYALFRLDILTEEEWDLLDHKPFFKEMSKWV